MSRGRVYNPVSQAFDPVYGDGTGTGLTPEEELELWREHDEWVQGQDESLPIEDTEEDKGWTPDTVDENIDIMEVTRRFV